LGLTVMPVDNVAHLGGALAGFVLGYVLVPRYQVDPSRHIVDKASLRRRWWVPVLSLVLLVGSMWQLLDYWSTSSAWLSTIHSDFAPSSMGEPIEYGQTVEGYLADFDDVQTWTFEGEAGHVVAIRMESDRLDCYLELYGPEGDFLIEDDDGGLHYDARIDDYILPASGRYVIFARSVEGHEAAYYLTLELVNTLNPDQLDGSGGVAGRALIPKSKES